MQDYADVRRTCRHEPKSVTIYVDNRLIESDSVGISATARLEIRLMYPVVNGHLARSTPKISRINTVLEKYK